MILNVIFNEDWQYPTIELFEDTQIMNIQFLFSYHCVIRVFHNLKNIQYENIKYTGSVANNILPAFLKKTLTQRSFYYFGSKFLTLFHCP